MFLDSGKYFKIEEFEKYGIKAVFTKKILGNMSPYIENEISRENRKNILKLINSHNKKIIYAKQTHSNNILVIKKEDDISRFNNLEDIDGFITSRYDIAIFTYYADCLPIYILDKNQKIYGIAHSGWRGTKNRIIITLIKKMIENFNSKINDIIIGLGIGISIDDYEVSKDFYFNFKNSFPSYIENCFKNINNQYYFDNIKLNEYLALEYGIKKENLIIDDRGVRRANTFSHRLDKENIGRSAAIITYGI